MTNAAIKEIFEGIGPCLDELEVEYLRTGIDHCKGLQDHSHLSAYLMLGVRSVCLLRGMLQLADPQFLDSFDSVRRAFIECWHLQLEFKMKESTAKAQKWLEGKEWQADKTKIEALIQKLQGGAAGFGREFGELSALAHPTWEATRNSVSIASTIVGMHPKPESLHTEFEKLAKDYVGMTNRLIWLTLFKTEEFIDTPISEERLSTCQAVHHKFLEASEA